MSAPDLKHDLSETVRHALSEDIGSGDITASLIPAEQQGHAQIIVREAATICGVDWVNEVFAQVDQNVELLWHVADGDQVQPNQLLFEAKGKSRSLLTAERCALNFLQTLSGTATRSRYYANLVSDTAVRLLDTRKTLPGLRNAQKYAVTCGGCYNHRIGLYDAFLIKENHIAACGSIAQAVSQARQNHPDKPVEVEVESIHEMNQAQDAGADIVMLDNFDLETMRDAVKLRKGAVKLEASGGITEETLKDYAETGVDFISIGALTKDCKSIDLSMRLI